MEKFNINRLKRNADSIKKKLKVVGDMTIAKDDLLVMFPTRYIDKKLCFIGNDVKVIGLYAVIDYSNNYGVVSAPIFQNLSPNNISDVEVNNVSYKLLLFDKDAPFLSSNKLIVSDSFIYNEFSELFLSGNIPWYINYQDLVSVFLETKKYANSNIGNDSMAFEILTSIVSRDPSNKRVYFRQILNKHEDINPAFIGLNNLYYSFDNTGAKILGNYFGEGVIAAIIDKEKKTSATSEILRA